MIDVWGIGVWRVLQESKKGLQILDLKGFASLCSSSNMQLKYKWVRRVFLPPSYFNCCSHLLLEVVYYTVTILIVSVVFA